VAAVSAPPPRLRPAGDDLGFPRVPPGYHLDLGRRGTTFFRAVEGPEGAPTVLLLHGWMASAGLNWFQAFEQLGTRFHVVAPDLRGHGRGLRSHQRFTLAACADDVAEMLVELGTGPVVAVGYSMGGPVAQLLWRRHRDLVGGLVLCATSPGFLPVARERIAFQTMMAVAVAGTRFGGSLTRIPALARRVVPLPGVLPERAQAWVAGEFRRHDWRHVVEAGHAIATYSARRWIHEIDVPTEVLVTQTDRAVRTHLQVNMAESIPGAVIREVPGGHLACADPAFGDHLLAAAAAVTARARRWQATPS
jgi:3-oxoadipate enol-lactonase